MPVLFVNEPPAEIKADVLAVRELTEVRLTSGWRWGFYNAAGRPLWDYRAAQGKLQVGTILQAPESELDLNPFRDVFLVAFEEELPDIDTQVGVWTEVIRRTVKRARTVGVNRIALPLLALKGNRIAPELCLRLLPLLRDCEGRHESLTFLLYPLMNVADLTEKQEAPPELLPYALTRLKPGKEIDSELCAYFEEMERERIESYYGPRDAPYGAWPQSKIAELLRRPCKSETSKYDIKFREGNDPPAGMLRTRAIESPTDRQERLARCYGRPVLCPRTSLPEIKEEVPVAVLARRLKDFLKRPFGPTFDAMVRTLIRERNLDPVDVYTRANLSRQTYSRLMRVENPSVPKRNTAIAMAFGLCLNFDEAQALLATAGYTLCRNSRFDAIIEYALRNGMTDVVAQVNLLLFEYDQPLLGQRE